MIDYKADITEKLKVYNEVLDLMHGIALDYFKITHGFDADSVNADVEILGDEFEVSVEYDIQGSYGGESYCLRIPLSYLWEANWRDDLQKKRLEENIAAVDARIKREKEIAKAQEKAEYEYFQTLQKKYKNG